MADHALHASSMALLRQALSRFGNQLAVQQLADVHVGVAVLKTQGAALQLQVRCAGFAAAGALHNHTHIHTRVRHAQPSAFRESALQQLCG